MAHAATSYYLHLHLHQQELGYGQNYTVKYQKKKYVLGMLHSFNLFYIVAFFSNIALITIFLLLLLYAIVNIDVQFRLLCIINKYLYFLKVSHCYTIN